MAYEWTKVELFGQNNDGLKVQYVIADGASVSKGSLLQLIDARIASSGILMNVPVAGVASEDHVAGQGNTRISCWQQGIFEARASGAIGVGAWIVPSLGNYVRVMPDISASQAIVAGSFAMVIGRALETASDDEIINVRLNL